MNYVTARFIRDICFVLFTTCPRHNDTERTGVAVAFWIRIRGRSVRILARTQAILDEDFCVFRQSLQPGHDHLLPNPFHFISRLLFDDT
jgi:hypothetical protein